MLPTLMIIESFLAFHYQLDFCFALVLFISSLIILGLFIRKDLTK